MSRIILHTLVRVTGAVAFFYSHPAVAGLTQLPL